MKVTTVIKIAKAAVAAVTLGVAAVGAIRTAKNAKKLHESAVDAIQKAENDEIESDEQMKEINDNLFNRVGDIVFDAGAFLVATAATAIVGYLCISAYNDRKWAEDMNTVTRYGCAVTKALVHRIKAEEA
nr:MAG TPA: hypothetical protein [Caudoviricetes sp.]